MPELTPAMTDLPVPPGMGAWAFVGELASPERLKVCRPPRPAGTDEADLSAGVRVIEGFEDQAGLLRTAYEDLRAFLAEAEIPANGGYEVRTARSRGLGTEAFRLSVKPGECRIEGADAEGIRRGLYEFQQQMLRRGGPFLRLGETERQPQVRTRILRCFYGPKNRPPRRRDELEGTAEHERLLAEAPEYRDELLDDVDYYPDAYLSRLARQGINAIWITSSFRELCESRIIPEYGRHSRRRLQKLRAVIDKCARYGVRIFLLCIEPRGFGDGYKTAPKEILKAHPELAGAPGRFCTSTPGGLAYVEEAARTLFTEAPGLGGLINICVGEMPTHCCSGKVDPVRCPRCAERDPAVVLAESIEAMRRGMHAAAPQAELIAWPYSQYLLWGEERTVEAAARMPSGVTVQYNFESAGEATQLGRNRRLDDYWLAYAGPSELFRRCGRAVHAAGARLAAKLQVNGSYELATVPCIPVPGLLYDKFKAVHELDVTTAMLCWLIGGYPSLMTRAACRLSQKPFPTSKAEFLRELAEVDWPEHSDAVVEAWTRFEEAYVNYPYSRVFSYYGPMNDGLAWPLFLLPRDLPLFQSWKHGAPPSGDRIGECLMDEFPLAEAVTLCERMHEGWQAGLKRLLPLRAVAGDSLRHRRELDLAEAVGLHLASGRNILRFYQLREDLLYSRTPQGRDERIEEIEAILRSEIEGSLRLAVLAESDPRLGFHPDSECYVYDPQRLRYRAEQVRGVLAEELPALRTAAKRPGPMFPEYTGDAPSGPSYTCRRTDEEASDPSCAVWGELPAEPCRWSLVCAGHLDQTRVRGRGARWSACYDSDRLYVRVACDEPEPSSMRSAGSDRDMPTYWRGDCVELAVEGRRMWPARRFVAGADGARGHIVNETPADYRWSVQTATEASGWAVVFALPWTCIDPEGFAGRNLRLNVTRLIPLGPTPEDHARISWMSPGAAWPRRLLLGDLNPAELGWCRIEGRA